MEGRLKKGVRRFWWGIWKARAGAGYNLTRAPLPGGTRVTQRDLERILVSVADGTMSPREAAQLIAAGMYADLGFARVDLDRQSRKGFPEAIYCEHKTPDQALDIARRLRHAGQTVIATRAPRDVMETLRQLPQARVYPEARLVIIGDDLPRRCRGYVLVICGGTSDIGVAEEAAVCASVMGNPVRRLYDVGVAGIHRLLDEVAIVRAASVIIAVAGMDGALPSVVAGLSPAPVIAVPTSVGYGANFGGISALLTMLNSCAPGIAVVNIDNGYGAAATATLINTERNTDDGEP